MKADWSFLEGNISSEEHRFPTEDKRKEEKMPLYTWKAQDGSFTQHIKVVNFQLGLVCPSHVCVCRYSRWLSFGKLENWCKFVISLILQSTGLWWISFPKGKIQQTQNLAFVTAKPYYWTQHKQDTISPCPAILQWPRRVSWSRGKGCRHWPLTSAQAQWDQCKACPSMFEVCPFSFKKFF